MRRLSPLALLVLAVVSACGPSRTREIAVITARPTSAQPPPSTPTPTATSKPIPSPTPIPLVDIIERSFQLHILEADWLALGFPHGHDQAWTALRQQNVDDSLWVITEDDIDTYCWGKHHTIQLTSKASAEFRAVFGQDHYEVITQVFAVTLHGRWLYGGVFHDMLRCAAAPPEVPQIFTFTRGDHIILVLHSWGTDATADLPAYEIPEVRDLFRAQGKLFCSPYPSRRH